MTNTASSSLSSEGLQTMVCPGRHGGGGAGRGGRSKTIPAVGALRCWTARCLRLALVALATGCLTAIRLSAADEGSPDCTVEDERARSSPQLTLLSVDANLLAAVLQVGLEPPELVHVGEVWRGAGLLTTVSESSAVIRLDGFEIPESWGVAAPSGGRIGKVRVYLRCPGATSSRVEVELSQLPPPRRLASPLLAGDRLGDGR